VSDRRTVVAVLGSVNMDFIGPVEHFPDPGQTVLGGELATLPGGKGGNQAVAAARAGGHVRFFGAVGDDDTGRALTAHLLREGVDTAGLRTLPGVRSGVALITVAAGGENTIVVLPGANAQVPPADVTGADLLVCQLEIPLATVTATARQARAAGIPVLLNPSPATSLPADLLACVDVLVCNEGEAAALGEALADIPVVITTLGARGARCRTAGDSFEIPAPVVRPVDTTGAGDAFTGALALAWAQRRDPRDAVAFAAAAGALATTRPGAGTAAPTRAEIDALLR
jgi:ribokinase